MTSRPVGQEGHCFLVVIIIITFFFFLLFSFFVDLYMCFSVILEAI